MKKPAKKPAARTKKGARKSKSAAPLRVRRPAAPKRKKPRASKPAPRVVDNEKALELARTLATAVLDKKATDVVILDVRGRASYADYIVLASGESDVQLRAMADGAHERLKATGARPISTEGESGASWVLLDYGDVVAHLFDDATRSFYDLEGMWADAPKERVEA